MKHKIFLIAMTMAGMFVLSSVYAQVPHHRARKNPVKGNPGHCSLHFTEEQCEKAEEIDLQVEKQILPLRGKIAVLSAELKQMMIEENPDKSAIMKKSEVIGELQIEIKKLKIDRQLQIRALLTPDQRIKYDQQLLEKQGHMHSFHRKPGSRGMKGMKSPGQSPSLMMMDQEAHEAQTEE